MLSYYLKWHIKLKCMTGFINYLVEIKDQESDENLVKKVS